MRARQQWIEATVAQGSPEMIETTVEGPNGVPIDFTQQGADAQFNLARDWGATPLITDDLSAQNRITGDAAGILTIALSGDDTDDLRPSHRYVFTLWAKPDGGDMQVAARGRVYVAGTVRQAAE